MTRQNPFANLRREIAVLREILSFPTEEELQELYRRKQQGEITGLDAPVLEEIQGLLNTKRGLI